MPAEDFDRCPSCGAARPADAPDGLCPRCVLGHAMESASQGDDSRGPIAGPATMGRVLKILTTAIGSSPQVLLAEPEATVAGDDHPGVDGLAPAPAATGDAAHIELLGEIARGGMGAVLKGRDPDLGRDLAVKVLLEGHAEKADLARRFIEEAQITGQLQHPGVVPVYELGALADQRPFFTMKLVKGHTLAALLDGRDGPEVDRPRFVAVFEQVCRTLAYAHARGVIHRDLKPSNIMVGGFGEVQVMDWGLAQGQRTLSS